MSCENCRFYAEGAAGEKRGVRLAELHYHAAAGSFK